MFSKDKSKLIRFPVYKNILTYTISDSVTIIGNDAFRESQYLSEIIISSNVEEIEHYVFEYCRLPKK